MRRFSGNRGRTIVFVMLAWVVASVPERIPGQESAGWTELPLGPRLVAMGSQLTVSVRPWEAFQSNPAGLATARGSAFAVARTSWLQDVTAQYAGYLENAGWMSVAVWGGLLNVPGIERRTSRDERIGEFTAHHIVLGVAGARELGRGVEFGIGARWLYQKVDVYEAAAIAVDAGLRKRQLPGRFVAAICVRGLPLKTDLGDGGLEPRTMVSAGVARTLALFGREDGVLLEVDYFTHDATSGGVVAIEGRPHPVLSLRGAYVTGYELRRVSFGVGLRRGRFSFEYGYAPFRYGFGQAHAFGAVIYL